MGESAIPTTSPRRGEKAAIVRQGLKEGWDNDRIIKAVQDKFPLHTRKNIQTLISRYRHYTLKREQNVAQA
jgi:hypothetical protein